MDSLSYTLSLIEPLPSRPQPLPRLAPQLLDRASFDVARKKKFPWRVRTSLQRTLQEQVTEILRRHHRRLRDNGIRNAAALVMDVQSGCALAYVGNVTAASRIDGAEGQDVDIITAPRSTGSVLKPLLYAALLDAGCILPGSLIPDVPISIGGYMPRNFDRSYEGAVPASMALARSLNVPAVKMVQLYGIPRFCSLLRSLAMTTLTRPPDDYGISVILGGVEGSLWELTGIYAGLARTVNQFHDERIPEGDLGHAFFAPSYLALPGPDRSKTISRSPLSAGACWAALEAMKEVARPGEEAAWKDFVSSTRIAWKTGTSFGFRDGWAIGCTPHFAVGVWVGNATGEGRPGLVGIETAAPILFEIYDLLPERQWFETPELDLRRIAVCKKSGYRLGPACATADTVLAPAAGLHAGPCPYHQIIHLDAAGRFRVSSECESTDRMRHVSWFVLPATLESYYRRRHSDYIPLPSIRSGCTGSPEQHAMGLIYPNPNAAIYIPREIDGSTGRAVFQATHRDPAAVIYWHLDDNYLGSTTRIHEIAVNPDSGSHRLVLVDSKGERLERIVSVVPR